jgi:erythromycin esterase
MEDAGMVNIGQLARVTYGHQQVYLVGFSSYEGTVIAGENWGAPMQEMPLPSARKGSIEEILHREAGGNCYLLFSDKMQERFSALHPLQMKPHDEKIPETNPLGV